MDTQNPVADSTLCVKQGSGISKQATACLRAIAIIFMLMTHFMSYQQPANLITINLPHFGNIDYVIGSAAGLCVPIFAFINGYGLSASLENKNPLQTLLYLLKKACIFLLEYWVIAFSLFLPFVLASSGSLSVAAFFRTLIGYGGIHGFAWYVWFYLIVLVTVPFLRLCFPKSMKWWLSLILAYVPLAIVVIVWTLLDKNDAFDSWRGDLCYFISVVGGVAFYRCDGVTKIRGLLSKIHLDHWAFYLVIAILGFIAQGLISKAITSPITVLPIVFFAAVVFDGKRGPKPVDFVITWLARLSMIIWFVHYLFFAPYVNQFVPLFDWVSYARIGIVISLLGLLMCIPVSLLYCYLFYGVRKAIAKISAPKVTETTDNSKE